MKLSRLQKWCLIGMSGWVAGWLLVVLLMGSVALGWLGVPRDLTFIVLTVLLLWAMIATAFLEAAQSEKERDDG